MPQYNEYDPVNAEDVGANDLILWEVGGETFKMTKSEFKLLTSMVEIEDVAGTTYTLLAADQGKIKRASNASAKTVTVPGTSGFILNAPIVIRNHGAGDLSLSASGATINGNSTTLTQYQSAVLVPISTDVWDLYIGGAGSGSGLTTLSTPASLTMTAAGENDMDFVWDDVANEDGFEVQIAEDAGFTVNVQTDNVGAGILSTSFSGLTEGTTYYGRVKAVGDGVTYSDSGYATDSADTDDAGLVGLTPPSPATATVISDTEIDFAWTNVSNESGFSVQIATNAGFTTGVSTVSKGVDVLSHSFTGLTPSTHYYFRVKAVGDGVTYGDSTYTSDDDTTNATGGYDTDAQTYFTAVDAVAGSPLTTPQKDAYNDWVVAEKAAGRYTARIAIYPIMGGNAAAHAINAKNPGTYNLTFTGTWTHDANGMKSNGVGNAHAATGIYPHLVLGLNSIHMSFYCNDDSGTEGFHMGVGAPGPGISYGKTFAPYTYAHNAATQVGTTGSMVGMHIISRIASGQYYYVRAGVSNTVAVASTAFEGTNDLVIGNYKSALNAASGFRFAFAAVGTGLSSADAVATTTEVNALQTALGRA